MVHGFVSLCFPTSPPFFFLTSAYTLKPGLSVRYGAGACCSASHGQAEFLSPCKESVFPVAYACYLFGWVGGGGRGAVCGVVFDTALETYFRERKAEDI